MADRRPQERSEKTAGLMRKRLEQWRTVKQKTVNKVGARNIKGSSLSLQNKNITKPSLLAKKNCCSSQKPPCSCKAKENVSKSSLSSKSHTNMVDKKTSKPLVQKAPRTMAVAKGHLQRASESIQAASEKRNKKVQGLMNQRLQTKKQVNKKDPRPQSSLRTTREIKPYKDKQLEMRERLALWKTEKRNGCDSTSTSKQPQQKPGIKRASPTLATDVKQKVPRRSLKTSISSSKKQINVEKHISSTNKKESSSETLPADRTEHKSDEMRRKSSYFPNPEKTIEALDEQMSSESVSEDNGSVTISIHDEEALPRTPSIVKSSYTNKSISMRERLELWQQEKGRKSGISYTPWSTKRVKQAKSARKEASKEEENAPLPPQTLDFDEFDTMTCDTAEKDFASEELRERLRDCYSKLRSDDSHDDDVAAQLDEIHKSYSSALLCAEFWVCRAKIAEHQGDSTRVVCFFEQALVFRAEPEDLIKDSVAEYMAKQKPQPDEKATEPSEDSQPTLSGEVSLVTCDIPTTPEHIDDEANDVLSSVVKYSVTKATPFKSRLTSCDRPVITPVRRSARLERRSIHYPTMLQEHGLVVRHLDDLPEDTRQQVMFKPNFAVETDLNEAWKEMWATEL